jgi:hypothetical protein
MIDPPWLYWQLYVILTFVVLVVCRIISPRFLVTRVFFGTLALAFDTFSAWLVIAEIWSEPSDVSVPIWVECLMDLIFVVPGLLYTWRFAVWHQRVNSNWTLPPCLGV